MRNSSNDISFGYVPFVFKRYMEYDPNQIEGYLLMSCTQLRIHSNNAAHKIPVTI